MATTVKSMALKNLNWAKDFYLKDLDALPEDKLGASFAGQARAPYDFTYEVVEVNTRFLKQMKQEDAGKWPFNEGWAVAPDEFKNRETAKAKLADSIQNIIDYVESLSEEQVAEEFTIPGQDEPTSIGAMASFAGFHTNYHCAQLNYIQSLCGDLDMHWM